MTALRIINIVGWLIVLVYTAPSVIAILRGKPCGGDPPRLIYASFSVVVIGFNLRGLLVPESSVAQSALMLLSIAVAAYTVLTARSYGRGDPHG